MPAAENLYDTTHNLMTPDTVQKFSLALNEPEDKVQAGLQSVVPTLLDGIINEGSTPQGAKKIAQLMEDLKKEKRDGETVVKDILGDDYRSIATSITPETGLAPQNVEKLMKMAAPVVLGAVESQLEEINPTAVNGFLKEQKNLATTFRERNRPSFGLVIGIMALIFLSIFFFFTRTIPVETIEENLTSLEKSVTPQEPLPPASVGLTVQDLPGFLATAKTTDLPKRFTLKAVRFKRGTTDMKGGGDQELNTLVAALKRFPKAIVRIEAYIEDTGDEDENLLYSENRAMLVREELIGRGIEASRIRAEGRGPSSDKDQIYFVITRIR